MLLLFKDEKVEECLRSENGVEYRGTMSEDEKGNKCKAWSSTRSASEMRPDDYNYCRNPDNGPRPWCWVVSGSAEQWGYCNIPKCGES